MDNTLPKRNTPNSNNIPTIHQYQHTTTNKWIRNSNKLYNNKKPTKKNKWT